MDNNKFSIQEKKAKNRSGKFLTSVIFAFIFGLLGALLAIYLVFNNFIKNEEFKKFFGLNNLSSKTEYVENSNDCYKKLEVDLKDFNNTAIGVAEKVIPSIVNIDVKYDINTIFNSKATSQGTGSGVILSEEGYILTNNHVVSPKQSNQFFTVSEAKDITVTLSDDKKYEAEIVGVDQITDLAVIKLKNKPKLTPAKLGNSDNVKIGEFVMAVGSPLGFKGSVTNGIVSSTNRKVTLKDGTSLTAIQTNASINSGNSGGALVNSNGEVIGINTLKLAGGGIEGLGFAIPINDTKNIVKQLIDNKKVERPSLGFSGKEISESISKEYGMPQGILVNEVFDNSTAKEADLKSKDIVIKFNGKEVKSFSDIEKLKTEIKIGDEVTFTVIREGKEKELKAKVVKLQDEKEQNKENNKDENNKENEENIKNFNNKNKELFEYFFGN